MLLGISPAGVQGTSPRIPEEPNLPKISEPPNVPRIPGPPNLLESLNPRISTSLNPSRLDAHHLKAAPPLQECGAGSQNRGASFFFFMTLEPRVD